MKLNILLVDSNNSFRERVTAMLRDKGYAVFEANSLTRASQIIKRERIDLVCVDSVVRGEQSVGFLQSLEPTTQRPLVAFIAHPAAAAEGEKRQEADISVDVLLRRPLSPEELVYTLDTRLKLRMLEDHEIKGSDIEYEEPVPRSERVTAAGISQTVLKKRYANKVPLLFAELGELLVEASEKKESVTELQEAHRIAHMLSGTAGSIGLRDVSSAIHAVEGTLKEMVRMRRLTSAPAKFPIDIGEGDNVESSKAVTASSTLLATVLVVDDDADFLSSIEIMGRENLIQILSAKTGDEAISIIKTHRVDAAIFDILLANGEDAYNLARQIRSIPGYRDLPLGFISVDSSVPQRIAAVHAGASIFLDKPLQSAEFLAAVRRLVPVEQRNRPKILVVDDDADFLRAMILLLETEGVEVVTLESANNIVEELTEIRPDLVLLDVVMDGVNGMDACRVLRSTEAWRDIPVLMLTVYGNRNILVKCFEAGADDYVEKPIIKDELLARIRLRLDRIQMYRERADIDVLTGLPTRRPFLELLKMRIAEGIRFNKPVALCLLDLDHFKEINDTFGHLAGDRVLAGLGLLLNSRFRTMDVRGRWGGEEFVVAFFGEDAETAEMIVSRVLEEFRNMPFKGDHDELFQVTFSAGVAAFPTAGKSIEELFRQVDRNLYTAKEKGRNQISR
jgi:diguanylate cyclase (GGDEF)-like protein